MAHWQILTPLDCSFLLNPTNPNGVSFLPRDVIKDSNERNKHLAAQKSYAGLALRFAKSICTLIRSTHSGKTSMASPSTEAAITLIVILNFRLDVRALSETWTLKVVPVSISARTELHLATPLPSCTISFLALLSDVELESLMSQDAVKRKKFLGTAHAPDRDRNLAGVMRE